MRDVLVDAGGGVLPLKRNIRVSADYATFLAQELAILRRRDLQAIVLEHVIAHECPRPCPGLIAEFGVFSGVSINKMAALLEGQQIYGFDSFAGLPGRVIPGFSHGYFTRSSLPKVAPNVTLVRGWFEETIPHFLADHPSEPAALLHIDCDLYSSTKSVLNLMSDRIVSGTILVFDEIYNSPSLYQAEMKAFYEFIARTKKRFEWIGHGYDVGCFARLPGIRGWLLWTGFRTFCAVLRRTPRLKKAAAVRIL